MDKTPQELERARVKAIQKLATTRNQLKQAQLADYKAWEQALKAGWTTQDLEHIGYKEPAAKKLKTRTANREL